MARTKSRTKLGDGLFLSPSGRFEFSARVTETVDGRRIKRQRWIGCETSPGVKARNVTEARAAKKRFEGQDEVDYVLPEQGLTFHGLAAPAFEARNYEGRTLATHQANLRNYLEPIADMHPGKISAAEFHRLVLVPMKKRKLSDATIGSALQTASVVYGHGVFEKKCPRNIIRDLGPHHRKGTDSAHKPRVVTAEEFARIIQATGDETRKFFTGLHYQVCFGLFMLCGLRLGEALGLQWEDIDWQEGTISIERQLVDTGTLAAPKTDESKDTVDLPLSLAAQLRQLQRWAWANTDDPKFVMAGRDGHRLTRSAASQQLTASAKRAGLEPLPSPHDLRHSFGSALMARVGLDPRITVAYVSRQMRHKNVNITLGVYTHVWDEGGKTTAIDDIFGSAYDG